MEVAAVGDGTVYKYSYIIKVCVPADERQIKLSYFQRWISTVWERSCVQTVMGGNYTEPL